MIDQQLADVPSNYPYIVETLGNKYRVTYMYSMNYKKDNKGNTASFSGTASAIDHNCDIAIGIARKRAIEYVTTEIQTKNFFFEFCPTVSPTIIKYKAQAQYEATITWNSQLSDISVTAKASSTATDATYESAYSKAKSMAEKIAYNKAELLGKERECVFILDLINRLL